MIIFKEVSKSFGNREIFNIEDLKINKYDKVGIVGTNGSGKTTLLNMIAGIEDYSGDILLDKNIKVEYLKQIEGITNTEISKKSASILKVPSKYNKYLSGGEKTKFKIADLLNSKGNLYLVDEPTNNLDINGIKILTKAFKEKEETMLIISHNREFLDNVCNKIIEIENKEVKLYDGNYSKYLSIKEEEIQRQEFLYESYEKEKDRLKKVVAKSKEQSKNIRKTPKRMGNSESRLHRMGGQKNKAKVDKFVKSLETRIEKLEIVEKPKEVEEIKLEINEKSKVYAKILVDGKNINKSFKDKIIFKDASFQIHNNKKTAIIGENGSGKSTLINMIVNRSSDLKISTKLKIGYFNQDMSILDYDKSILENVMENSIYDENTVRKVLGRFLIKDEKVNEKASILSGGERVKISLCKIILEDINILILDEITNHLDINSIEVIEEALMNYDRAIIFVSHDKTFVDNIADELLIIKDKKINKHMGNYSSYIKSLNKKYDNYNLMILESKMSEIIGKLSMEIKKEEKEKLNREYDEILKNINKIKKEMN
ncbi:ribosomal protection-like ABC-F family protein [Peptoniphilus stercorisuis]|uniref:ATPase subunit of ABC transporter with duplicated ATPase domains n=1 Tax=Peptoniphilus stercorisuis TaxID=1436965 RepID=A0ABS4KBA7_9FIRM|nr:ABC-F type ribosomal protection protein [Peptoniphilus stercorisuis]MBP2025060.1 ATPase subunit of ABC transporter with duplicated ATPase domains [Peptoniphilus stercorisuis]